MQTPALNIIRIETDTLCTQQNNDASTDNEQNHPLLPTLDIKNGYSACQN
jgi:hypothetical protein